MAFTANTAFEARITNNQFDDLCNITGKFQSSSADADCDAGLLCVRGGQLDCEGFSGVKNENAFVMTAAANTVTADDVIYACNTYETKMIDGYHVGSETLGLGVPAGKYGTFTKINFDGQSVYRFGVGNTSGTIGTNQYFTINAGKLATAASAPTTTGAVYFKIRGTGTFTRGTSAAFTYYDVVGHRVSTVA